MECYFWILGVYFEPRYYLARRILTKVISFTSVIDDIYDVYGTTEELNLFTDAIQRFNSLARAYFDKANWYDKGYVPTMEEYMEVVVASAGYRMLAITSCRHG
ncbi:hypothetical protein LguiA_002339 [Lonicera macranthoides]